MTRHFLWNEHAELLTKPLATVLMDLRREDGDNDLLMDSVTLAELTEEADRMLAIDGVVAQYNQIERVAGQMEAVMRRAAGTIKPVAKQISDPFTQHGALQVVVLFELSDGQTVSVYFHNPDTTPKKIAATDELVSWKWLLNKKDVTILVAPEQGKELNAREVARRVMKAAEKNSAAFVRNNAKRAERLQAIEAMKTEIVELETECKDLERQIEEARLRQEEPVVEPETALDPTTPDGYAELQRQGDEALAEHQDQLDAFFQERVVAVRNALRDLGWKGMAGESLKKDAYVLKPAFKQAGAGRNIVGMHYEIAGVPGFFMSDDLTLSPEELAKRIDLGLPQSITVPEGYKTYEYYKDGNPATAFMRFAVGDRVQQKSGLRWAGTVEAPFGLPDQDRIIQQVLVKWDNGTTTTEWARDLESSNGVEIPEPGPEPTGETDPDPTTLNLPSLSNVAAHLRRLGWEATLQQDGTVIAFRHPGTNDDYEFWASDLERAIQGGLTTAREIAYGIDEDYRYPDSDTSAEYADHLGIDEGLLLDEDGNQTLSNAFLRAVVMVRDAAKMYGMTLNYGDFNGSFSGGLFDSVAPTDLVYGAFAQIVKDGRGIGRAFADEDGRVLIYRGLSGPDAVEIDGAPAKASTRKIDVADMMAALDALAESGEIGPATPKLDRDAIARVDAAYRFEHASDEFKEWVSESVDKPDYSPFVTAREMDKRAKAHGATIEWGFFDGAALDSVYVAEGDEDWDDEDSGSDPDTAPLFDGNPNWHKQPRERRTGRWRRSRGRQLKAAAGKAGRAVAKAARQAGSYVAQALKSNGKGRRSLYGAGDVLEGAAKMDPGMAAINELVGGAKTIKGVFDSVAFDSIEQDGYVGKIRKDGEIVGRVDMCDDGKAMVFVGADGSDRVSIPGKPEIQVYYSDSDAPDMVDWLFAGLAGGQDDPEPQPEPTPTETQRTALDVVRDLIRLLDDLGLQRPDLSRKKAKKIDGFVLSNDYTSRDGKQVTFGSDSKDSDEHNRRVTVVAMKGRAETRIEITGASVAEAVYQQIADFFAGLDNAKAAEFDAGLSKDVDTSDPDVREHLARFKEGIFEFVANTNKDAYLKAVRAFLEGDMALAEPPLKDRLIDLSDLPADAGFMPKPIDKAIKAVTKPKDFMSVMLAAVDPKDVRYYLRGVKVEEGRLISTNGNRLVSFKTDTSEWASLKDRGAGDAIVDKDGNLIDGRYPEVDRVIPKRKSDDATAEMDAAKLAARCRGVLKAAKMIGVKKDGQDHFPIAIKVGNRQAPFSAKYLLDVAETFLRFGYASLTASLHEVAGSGVMLMATSLDEKLTQVVMSKNYKGNSAPNYMAPLGDEVQRPGQVEPQPEPEPEPQPTGGEPDQRAELEEALQALIDRETDTGLYIAELERVADLAEAAGLMEALDAKLNEAADRLTVLLNEEAARVA